MAKRKPKSASVIGDHEYDTVKIRDKSGKLRTSRGNNDAIAKAMLIYKAGGGELDHIINANKLQDRMKPHAKKQEGLRRMTLGVMLRALVRNGTPAKVGKIIVAKLTQKVDLPKVEKLNGHKPAKKAKAKKAAKPRKARARKSAPVEQIAEAA